MKEDSQEENTSNSPQSLDKKPIYGVSLFYAPGASLIGSFLQYFGVALQATPVQQSLLVSVRNLGTAILQPFFGRRADRLGRKPFLLLGLICLALTSVVMIFATDPWILIFLAGVQTALGLCMFLPAWTAILGDYSDKKSRGELIGRVGSLGTAFSAVAILASGVLMSVIFGDSDLENIRAFILPFLTATVSFIIAGVISLFIQDHYKVKIPNQEENPPIRTLLRDNRPFRRLLIINTLFMVSLSFAWPVFPYVAVESATTWVELGGIWAIFQGFFSLGQFGSGRAADKFGRKRVLLVIRFGFWTIPSLYGLALITGDFTYIWFTGILGGFCMGSGETALIASVLDTASEETRATYSSILSLSTGVFTFLGSLTSGVVTQYLQIFFTFRDSLILMLFVIAILRMITWVGHIFLVSDHIEAGDSFPLAPVNGKV